MLNGAVFHEGTEVQAPLIAPSDTAVLTGCLKQGPNEEGARLDAGRSLVLLHGEAQRPMRYQEHKAATAPAHTGLRDGCGTGRAW